MKVRLSLGRLGEKKRRSRRPPKKKGGKSNRNASSAQEGGKITDKLFVVDKKAVSPAEREVNGVMPTDRGDEG